MSTSNNPEAVSVDICLSVHWLCFSVSSEYSSGALRRFILIVLGLDFVLEVFTTLDRVSVFSCCILLSAESRVCGIVTLLPAVLGMREWSGSCWWLRTGWDVGGGGGFSVGLCLFLGVLNLLDSVKAVSELLTPLASCMLESFVRFDWGDWRFMRGVEVTTPVEAMLTSKSEAYDLVASIPVSEAAVSAESWLSCGTTWCSSWDVTACGSRESDEINCWLLPGLDSTWRLQLLLVSVW